MIEYGSYQIPEGTVGSFSMNHSHIPADFFGKFFFAQSADGPFGSVTLVNEGRTLENQSSVGPYVYFVPGRAGMALSLNWWHAGTALNTSSMFQNKFQYGIETVDYSTKRVCKHVPFVDMVCVKVMCFLRCL